MSIENSAEPLLVVENLVVRFPLRRGLFGRTQGWVHAVEDVSFHLEKGQTIAIVGESGSGKTTIGRALVRINEPMSGSIRVGGTDIRGLRGRALRAFRRRIQMVFQDPYASLDPLQTVGQIVAQPLRVHKLAARSQRKARVTELLETVNLGASSVARYPHEFSGGQRQRIGIARALAAQPEVIVCDEPLSSLDVSVQAQIVALLRKSQQLLGVSYVFIAHDLAIVRYLADRVMVMYLGRVMEIGSAAEVYGNPRHPYTQALLSAIPVVNPDVETQRERIMLTGDVPSPIDPPTGCVFHTRCPLRELLGNPEICVTDRPVLDPVEGDADHAAACHFPESQELLTLETEKNASRLRQQ